ncbi:Protein-glutamine glutaminase [Saliniradius amylolyticus]|uniref:Probable chemoreceptor glutamine deamidase CheD n=1 Tax=Saliniradius amylolyticus TaxID=2183582 RepID=A0A2S2E646_9ALTE|nr:chemotaxis protein CheD [Saliniradius amylolyticus]AWL13121.1 Protein-glutamine glutaminase [Saliniradius amylolyticus]
MNKKVYLAPGEFVIGNASQRLYSTVLGSCVSVIMFDPAKRFYAMCHYLMVGETSRPSPELVGRYGSFILPSFHKHVLRRGIDPAELEVSLIGGATSANAQGLSAHYRVGERNVDYGFRFLEHYGYSISLQDVGGINGRRVKFNADSGEVNVETFSGVKTA